jgi:hypothetical protein
MERGVSFLGINVAGKEEYFSVCRNQCYSVYKAENQSQIGDGLLPVEILTFN